MGHSQMRPVRHDQLERTLKLHKLRRILTQKWMKEGGYREVDRLPFEYDMQINANTNILTLAHKHTQK